MISPHQLSQIESKLSAAVLRAQERGLQVLPGDWGIDWNLVSFECGAGGSYRYEVTKNRCLCPLSAGLLYANLEDMVGIHSKDAAKWLGVSQAEVSQFIEGVDSPLGHFHPSINKSMYHLGQRFRKHLL